MKHRPCSHFQNAGKGWLDWNRQTDRKLKILKQVGEGRKEKKEICSCKIRCDLVTPGENVRS
jgi:hypothetical protein